MIGAQRVDFVAIPTRDRDRAAAFYGDTLGLERNPLTGGSWPEFGTGNVTLAVVVPEQMGLEFAPLPFGAIAIPYRTSPRHARRSSKWESSSSATRSTRASATWRSSTTRTATR